MHTTADGVRLFTEEIGDGLPIVMLHGGLGMDHTYFRPDFDQLADEWRVVYVDQRGNGRSDIPEAPITFESLAADAADLIRGLGGSAAVIGHSMGGFIAQELALTHPEVVERLVLLSTTPGQPGAADDPDADPGPPMPGELLELMSAMPTTDEEYAAGMLDLIPFYMYGDPQALVDRVGQTILRVRAMSEGFQSLARWSSIDRLDGLTMPVLLLVGDHDLFTAHQQSERIARLVPHAQLQIIEDTGHFPWLEAPDRFFKILRGFLSQPTT